AKDGGPARIGVLDVGGATLEDGTAWSTWQDPDALRRGSGSARATDARPPADWASGCRAPRSALAMSRPSRRHATARSRSARRAGARGRRADGSRSAHRPRHALLTYELISSSTTPSTGTIASAAAEPSPSCPPPMLIDARGACLHVHLAAPRRDARVSAGADALPRVGTAGDQRRGGLPRAADASVRADGGPDQPDEARRQPERGDADLSDAAGAVLRLA